MYEVYVSSFLDTNGDGVGDLGGIIAKLDYLQSLGVDIVWVTPHYQSPQVDMGYDISDYKAIHEPYGTMADCDELIAQTHRRGMKIIFDLVINHTSDLHPWFEESRQSRDSPKRHWYIWRPPRYDAVTGAKKPPTNWRSSFGGSVWQWDEATREYYLHVHAVEQPDLNWENDDCRRAIYDSAVRFWLDKGIDGFRIDTVNRYSKGTDFQDAPVIDASADTQVAFQYFTNGPRLLEWISELRTVLDEYDVFVVGELPNTPKVEDVLKFVSAKEKRLDMVLNFDTVGLGQTPGDRFRPRPFSTADFARELTRWPKILQDTDAWGTVFLENHDQGRSVSHFLSDEPTFRVQAAKALATLQATMTGTLFLYQGQEIGMINAPMGWPLENYTCLRTKALIRQAKEKSANGDGTAVQRALESVHIHGRDHARVPMQWDASTTAGFCPEGVTPWSSVLESHCEINVADQEGRADSVLEFWKQAIGLRKGATDLFVYGRHRDIELGPEVIAFEKIAEDGRTAIVVANLSTIEQPMRLSTQVANKELVLCSIHGGRDSVLAGFEARVYISFPQQSQV